MDGGTHALVPSSRSVCDVCILEPGTNTRGNKRLHSFHALCWFNSAPAFQNKSFWTRRVISQWFRELGRPVARVCLSARQSQTSGDVCVRTLSSPCLDVRVPGQHAYVTATDESRPGPNRIQVPELSRAETHLRYR